MSEILRPEIKSLMELGLLPSTKSLQHGLDSTVARYENLILSIQRPVTDAEARALTRVFGDDDAFGLAWALISLVESAPGWPLRDCLPENSDNEWIALLRERAA